MNESENLLIIALSQLGCLSNETEIKSLLQITNEEFAKILLKLSKKITLNKGIEMTLPETLSKDLSSKYKECQKLVDFLKHLGYKADINLNNILFPSTRDMQRIFEFTLEYATNYDNTALEYEQNFSDKNYLKIKISKHIQNWSKETWLVPEFKYAKELETGQNSSHSNVTQILKLENQKLNFLKKKLIGLKVNVPENINKISKNKSDELMNDSRVNIITEDEFKIVGISTQAANNNKIIEQLKRKNKGMNSEKSTNQQFVDLINKRNTTFEFQNKNFSENNFVNNMKILEKRNKQIYGKTYFTNTYNKPNDSNENKFNQGNKYGDSKTTEQFDSDFRTSTTSVDPLSKTKNKNKISESTDKGQSIYQKKIDSIMLNYEKEKEIKNLEIKDLSVKLQNVLNSIEQQSQYLTDQNTKKEELTEAIEELSVKNQNLIKSIEEKLETFEQIQKLNKSEIREQDLNQEVLSLEKKFDEMISNWDEYSSQAKSRVEELKNSIEVKKKEYNFKYEKISSLKKEIEEISSKILLKQELANFLNEEYQKIPVDINRNKFITKISELTQNIFLEKNNISKILNELRQSENQIVSMNDTIKRVDNELEDKLYQDAKNTSSLKDLYALFINIRDGYNSIQKNIIDSQIMKNKIKELENKVDDYQQKLKSYDYNQLREQVEFLKSENNKTFKNK